MTTFERKRSKLQILCPHNIGPQAFRFFDSHDFIRYQDRPDPGLLLWQIILNGHRDKALVSGTLTRQDGGNRIEAI